MRVQSGGVGTRAAIQSIALRALLEHDRIISAPLRAKPRIVELRFMKEPYK